MSKALTSAGHSLVAVQDNLIDVVWPDRPERPSAQLRTLGSEYAGQCPSFNMKSQNNYSHHYCFIVNKDQLYTDNRALMRWDVMILSVCRDLLAGEDLHAAN